MLDNTNFGIAALAACGIHEFSHLLVMTFCGIPAEEITFYGAGVRISSPQVNKARTIPRLAILGAGCLANFLVAIVYWFACNDAAATINLLTGAFNLLPIGEHDGAEIMKMFLIRTCRPEKLDKSIRFVGIVAALFAGSVVLLLGRGTSFIFLTTLLYILVVSFKR